MSTDMVPSEEGIVRVPDKPCLWRREKYLELGFTQGQAFRLADSKDAIGFAVYWGDVHEVLQRVEAANVVDDPHAVVFDIFNDGE